MKLTSPAFKLNEHIPDIYSCNGKDINPQLDIEDIPSGTESLALIMDDPDAPIGNFVHWVAFNIPVQNKIKPNTEPGVQGKNNFNKNGYGGPCPPGGTHRYYFTVYALDTKLNLSEGSDKKSLEKAMKGHVLDRAKLIGLYSKK